MVLNRTNFPQDFSLNMYSVVSVGGIVLSEYNAFPCVLYVYNVDTHSDHVYMSFGLSQCKRYVP